MTDYEKFEKKEDFRQTGELLGGYLGRIFWLGLCVVGMISMTSEMLNPDDENYIPDKIEQRARERKRKWLEKKKEELKKEMK